MIAKAGLGIIGLGAIGIGGVAVAKPHLLGMDYMPEFHALSKDSDFSTASNYAESNFGKKYKNYLVGATNKTSGNDNTSNKAWWEWSFRRLKAHKSSSEKFKYEGKKTSDAVTMAYAKDNAEGYAKALNQVCKAAYKTTATDVGDSETAGKFKKSDVWKYCSPLGQEPTKSNTNNYGSNIGSDSAANFISVEKGVNDMFWEIRDKEIKENDPNFEKIAPSSTESYFTKPDKTLRELCEEAYRTSKTGGTDGSPTLDTTKKYCVFEISSSAT